MIGHCLHNHCPYPLCLPSITLCFPSEFCVLIPRLFFIRNELFHVSFLSLYNIIVFSIVLIHVPLACLSPYSPDSAHKCIICMFLCLIYGLIKLNRMKNPVMKSFFIAFLDVALFEGWAGYSAVSDSLCLLFRSACATVYTWSACVVTPSFLYQAKYNFTSIKPSLGLDGELQIGTMIKNITLTKGTSSLTVSENTTRNTYFWNRDETPTCVYVSLIL